MIERKNIVLCIVLSLVTCGIFALYWFVCLTNDTNSVSDSTKTASGGMAILFTILSCGIYSFYWVYKCGTKLNEAKAARGLPVDSNSGVLYLVLSLLGLSIVSWALIQSELNQLADQPAA